MKAKSRDEIALESMRKEHSRLCMAEGLAIFALEEHQNAPLEIISISRELNEIILDTSKKSAIALEAIEELSERQTRAELAAQKNGLELIDAIVKAQLEREALERRIEILEFKVSRRGDL